MEDISCDIIKEAQTGSISAFEQLYKQTSGFVYSVALRVTNNTHMAQEVTQDVFIKIYNSLQGFELRSSFKTWAYRITVNTALNACKKMNREYSRRQDFEDVADTLAASVDTKAELSQKEESCRDKERLTALLNLLNPDQRACIVLREIEGLSYQEISQALRININTVRSRLKRARQALMAHSRREV